MSDAYIVEAVRTPIGKGRPDGAFANTRADDLAGTALTGLVKRAGIRPGDVEDVVMGCVTQVQEQGVNIARNALLAWGFPEEVTGTTVNRLCGSSQQALHFAAQGVMAGAYDLVIGAGVESMGRVPMGSDIGPFNPKLLARYNDGIVPQGVSAELVAERWKVTRQELDRFSYQSHMKAVAAQKEGRFAAEIVPVEATGPDGSKRTVTVDEGPRPGTSMEKMATLPTPFKEGGVVTAANSSQISDGAAAVLVASEGAVKRFGLKPKARFRAFALAGVDPVIMLTGPIPATKKVLERAGLALSDIDLFEVNEAFASVVVAWAKEVGAPMERVNVNGGAVALGHPLGCSGARLITTIVHELERRGGRYGLVTMCIGFGQATATIIERM